MTDQLTLAIRRARYAKDAPRRDPRVRSTQHQQVPPAETVTSPPPAVHHAILNGHSMKAVQHLVAAVYGIDVAEMVGARRTDQFVLPRQVAMYVCSELLQVSSVEIGRRFNRDHSTVLHAIGKIGKLRLLDAELGLKVQKLMDDFRTMKPRRIMSGQQYSMEEKLAEILRQLEHRREVYPFRITMKVMRQEEAARRIAILEAIARDYREMLDDRDLEAMGNDQNT